MKNRSRGMGVVKANVVLGAICNGTQIDTSSTHYLMKAITTKEFVSLVIIAITAPLFALALVGGVQIMYASGDGVFLLALTLCGAIVSGINGFGRRTAASRTPVA